MSIPISDTLSTEFQRLAVRAQACRQATESVVVHSLCDEVLSDLDDIRQYFHTEIGMQLALAVPAAKLEEIFRRLDSVGAAHRGAPARRG